MSHTVNLKTLVADPHRGDFDQDVDQARELLRTTGKSIYDFARTVQERAIKSGQFLSSSETSGLSPIF